MATNVTLINNSLVKEYLHYDANGQDVIVHSSLTHADNFKLVDNGTSLHIETHSNPSVKIRVDSDTLTTGTSGTSEVFTSGGTTAVKIYFEETDGDRWYLRVNSDNNEAVEIVSESYVNKVILIDFKVYGMADPPCLQTIWTPDVSTTALVHNGYKMLCVNTEWKYKLESDALS